MSTDIKQMTWIQWMIIRRYIESVEDKIVFLSHNATLVTLVIFWMLQMVGKGRNSETYSLGLGAVNGVPD